MTRLYWDFLNRNRALLQTNPRLRIVMSSAGKRSSEKQAHDDGVRRYVQAQLRHGKPVELQSVQQILES